MATTSAKSTANEKNARVSSSDLESDVQQLRADMAQIVDHLKAMGGQSGSAARKAAGDGLDQLRGQGEAALRNAKGNAQEFEHELARTVRDRPVTALALAAGAGFLLALVTRR